MNKKISIFILLVTLLSPLVVFAQPPGGGNPPPPPSSNPTTLTYMANSVKTAVTTIGGAIAVIGWIVAGILYLTAAGAPDKLGVAKKAMIAAVIGTLLVVMAQGTTSIMNVIGNAFGLPAI